MLSATNRITIRRPIEDVFAVLTDVEQTGVWFPWDVQERWTSPPPHGLGATRHAIVRMWGRQSENDAVVTEYVPPFRAAMTGTSTSAPFVATLVFSREGDATDVQVTTEFRLHGASRIAGPAFAALYGRAWGQGLVRLKQLMESGAL
jgi:uncharacterized protein YndB with AHSA1/START domain